MADHTSQGMAGLVVGTTVLPAGGPCVPSQNQNRINIVPENPPIDVSLKLARVPATWRPIAKDGADSDRAAGALPTQVTIAVGQTYYFELRPARGGQMGA